MNNNIIIKIESKEKDISHIKAIREVIKWGEEYIKELGEEYYQVLLENEKALKSYLPAEDMIKEVNMYKDKILPQLICIHDEAEIYKIKEKKEYILHPKSKIAVNVGAKIMEAIYEEEKETINNMLLINGEEIDSKYVSSALIKYVQMLDYIEKKEE